MEQEGRKNECNPITPNPYIKFYVFKPKNAMRRTMITPKLHWSPFSLLLVFLASTDFSVNRLAALSVSTEFHSFFSISNRLWFWLWNWHCRWIPTYIISVFVRAYVISSVLQSYVHDAWHLWLCSLELELSLCGWNVLALVKSVFYFLIYFIGHSNWVKRSKKNARKITKKKTRQNE